MIPDNELRALIRQAQETDRPDGLSVRYDTAGRKWTFRGTKHDVFVKVEWFMGPPKTALPLDEYGRERRFNSRRKTQGRPRSIENADFSILGLQLIERGLVSVAASIRGHRPGYKLTLSGHLMALDLVDQARVNP